MSSVKNKGKCFARAEVSEKQKEYIAILAELKGVTTPELLQQVLERFIDSNLELIKEYQENLKTLQQETKNKIVMNGE
ncbi:hypothetical protein [Streptococcus oralis]|uniref:Uncharacterized protein n=1 Tax=Streptococcus oralis TaxID=1303 RepID=A0A428ISH0_STROR|nr:hypothetical protein [Streptococcus oralis]RSK20752.1 hypothetical protein D8800_08765 [Streptococcus oralis]